MSRDPKTRFDDRVEHYAQHRPGYPPEIVAFLERVCGLRSQWVVADIGSGTGLLARLFIDHGCRVLGVEPNAAMRAAGDRYLAAHGTFTSVDGAAEATGLADGCVDLVAAGQAFHWFERPAARSEFIRILRPPGWVALIWNDRRKGTTPFLAGYEALLERWGTDYREVDHSRIGRAELEEFLGPDPLREAVFDNRQVLDFPALRGRLLSSSYAPARGQPGHQPMLRDLGALFDRYQVNGSVRLDYDTRVYCARLRPGG